MYIIVATFVLSRENMPSYKREGQQVRASRRIDQ